MGQCLIDLFRLREAAVLRDQARIKYMAQDSRVIGQTFDQIFIKSYIYIYIYIYIEREREVGRAVPICHV